MQFELLKDGKFALGLTGGVTAALFLLLWVDFFNLGLAKDTTLLGAIVGGFLAGLTSLVATILSNYFAVRAEMERRNETTEAVALSCFQKLHSAREVIVKAYRHYFDGSPDNIIAYSRPGEPRRSIPKPLALSKIDRRFNDDELSLALLLKDAELFNVLGEVDNFVSSYNGLSEAYAAQFHSFQSILLSDSGASYSGKHISSQGVAIHPLDILAIEDLRDLLLDCVRKATPLLERSHAKMVSVMYSNFGRKMEFAVDPEMPGHVVVQPNDVAQTA